MAGIGRGQGERTEAKPRNLERMERDAIQEALGANAGNRRKAAEAARAFRAHALPPNKKYKLG